MIFFSNNHNYLKIHRKNFISAVITLSHESYSSKIVVNTVLFDVEKKSIYKIKKDCEQFPLFEKVDGFGSSFNFGSIDQE